MNEYILKLKIKYYMEFDIKNMTRH